MKKLAMVVGALGLSGYIGLLSLLSYFTKIIDPMMVDFNLPQRILINVVFIIWILLAILFLIYTLCLAIDISDDFMHTDRWEGRFIDKVKGLSNNKKE